MRDTPAQWLTADDNLRERLVAAVAEPERTAVVMGAELALVADTPVPPGVTIEPVQKLEEWMAVAGETALDARREELERRAAVIASLGFGPDAPLQLRIARRAGRAVGIASFFLYGETVLGRHLGVPAVERRQGVGRALAQACASDARAAGARLAVLGPTPDTIAFYRLLGAVLRPALRDRSFLFAVASRPCASSSPAPAGRSAGPPSKHC
jgi:hypothetical protein